MDVREMLRKIQDDLIRIDREIYLDRQAQLKVQLDGLGADMLITVIVAHSRTILRVERVGHQKQVVDHWVQLWRYMKRGDKPHIQIRKLYPDN